MAGSRHDLVERNNNIVLEYQQQDVIRLTLPAQINGEAGSVLTVNARVDSPHGLERIEWDGSALVAAGGDFTQVSPQSVAMTLPAYQSARNSNSNVYTVTAVAYDSRGNASSRSTLQISVEPNTAGITEANLTKTADNAVANGTASNAVQALVAGNNLVKATVNDTSTQEKNSRFNGDIDTALIELAWIEKDNAIADDVDYVDLRARVIDANGNAVEGGEIAASWPGYVTPLSSTRTDADGISIHRFKSNTAGVTSIGLSTYINGIYGSRIYLTPVFYRE